MGESRFSAHRRDLGMSFALSCTIWLFNIAMENPLYMEVLMGKSSTNGLFSMAMFNNQRVHEKVQLVIEAANPGWFRWANNNLNSQ